MYSDLDKNKTSKTVFEAVLFFIFVPELFDPRTVSKCSISFFILSEKPNALSCSKIFFCMMYFFISKLKMELPCMGLSVNVLQIYLYLIKHKGLCIDV